MSQQKQPLVINYDNDYVRKVQAGILIPKKQHENFEAIKSELAEVKSLVIKLITERNS